MRRALLGTTVFGVMLFGLLQLAAADSDSITDPKGDASPAAVDIVKASVAHDGKRTLVHTVKLEGPVNANSDYQILLQMDMEGTRDCELEFIWPPGGDSPVVECGVGDTRKAGEITQPRPDTLKFIFDKRDIGSPEKYGWRIVTRSCAGCEDFDTAPNQDGARIKYVKHRLG